MDYAILIFVILVVVVTIFTRIKLAFIDAATPKYGFPGGAEGGQRRFGDHFGLGGMITWMFILGILLLMLYSMVDEGYRGNKGINIIKWVLFKNDESAENNDTYYPEIRVKDNTSEAPIDSYKEYDDDEFLNSFGSSEMEGATSQRQEATAAVESYSTSTSTAMSSGTWVQVLASNSEERAERVRGEWMNSGWGFHVVKMEEGGLHKVRLGPFLNEDLAKTWDKQNNDGKGYLVNIQ